MNAAPQAILFDFDGVIVDSEPLHCQSYVVTAAAFGMPLTERQYFAELIGFDDRGAIARVFEMFEKPLDGATMSAFLEQKSRISLGLIREGKFRPLPGVDSFIRAMADHCALGICTGALRAEVEGMLDGIGLREHFSVITPAEDVPVGKPDPSGYILTAARLSEMIGRQLKRSECLVVEDAPTVAARAREAGFAVLGVTTTYPAREWPSEIITTGSLDPTMMRRIFPQLPLETQT